MPTSVDSLNYISRPKTCSAPINFFSLTFRDRNMMENILGGGPEWKDADYDQHWPLLRDTVDVVLHQPAGSYHPFSYEKMYSAVYKCVCKHQAERLYADLMKHVEGVVKEWSSKLEELRQKGDIVAFSLEFHRIISQFFTALSSIVPIFIYLNRFYVESRLNTNLVTQLHLTFVRNLSDLYIKDLLQCMEQAPAMSISPAIKQAILKYLNVLNPQYCQLNTSLFANYLTGIIPPMSEDDLQSQIEADQQLQQQLRESGFNTSNQRLKRSNSDLDLHATSMVAKT